MCYFHVDFHPDRRLLLSSLKLFVRIPYSPKTFATSITRILAHLGIPCGKVDYVTINRAILMINFSFIQFYIFLGFFRHAVPDFVRATESKFFLDSYFWELYSRLASPHTPAQGNVIYVDWGYLSACRESCIGAEVCSISMSTIPALYSAYHIVQIISLIFRQ